MFRCPRAARCGLRNKGKRGLLRLRPCWGGEGRSSFGRASLRSLACICVACAPLRSLAYMGRVRRTASPALRAYMPRAHINAPPCCVKCVHERHDLPFFGQILTLVYTFLGEALCGFESLARCRKKPASQRNAGLAFTMAEREGFEPSRRSRAQRFSRPPHSTALPSLRGR